MSSGYVSTNQSVRPIRVKTSKQGLSCSIMNLSGTYASWNLNDHCWKNPTTSFRSGPSYDRSARMPGAVISERNLNEVLASEYGDFGHEFSMRRVAEFRGFTRSQRPSSSMSNTWSKLTNPTPTWFQADGTNPLVTDALDLNWSFVKSDSDLMTLGTSFVDATNPIQSQVNLLSDIAEAVSSGYFLPELLGKTIVSAAISSKKRRSLIRAIGGEYLNFIFGVKPLADDIAKVGFLIDSVNDLVDQWIKDNDTIVRRRRKVLGKTKNVLNKDHIYGPGTFSLGTSYTPVWVVPPLSTGLFNPQTKTRTESSNQGTSIETLANMANVSCRGFSVATTTSDISFSAGYEYDLTQLAIPIISDGSAADILHSAALRGELLAIAFGLDPTSIPRAAYDAVPFSWLLDWFVNIGDIIDNARNLQSKGVQMLWGYISETVKRDYYMEYSFTYNPTGKVFFQTNAFTAQKAIRRVRATPFGFGTSFGSLTVNQSAILAALAAAKSK